MDSTAPDHEKIMRAAAEIVRQRAAGPNARCGFCGMQEPRWEMEAAPLNGVEALQCAGCRIAAAVGLDSRLDLGRVPVRWSR